MKTNGLPCWLAALLALSAGGVMAQDLKAPPLPTVVGSERVDGALFQIVRTIPQAQRGNLTAVLRTDLRARAKAMRLQVREDDKIFVEIIGPAAGRIERDLALAEWEALGIEIGRPMDAAVAASKAAVHVPLTRTANRAEAWLPLAAIERLEALLPKGWRVTAAKPIEHDQVAGEGPAQINSTGYRDAGSNGAGLRIAVIDGNFAGLTMARNNGDAPAGVERNFAGGAFESGTSTHGTDCVQNVFDHAPGAAYWFYRIDTPTDYVTVVDECIANGVNIISHSLSQYNEGWGDDSGISCQQANRAAQNNILFFTSCGNRADSHYEGAFVDTDGDGFHEFAPGDETIDVTIGTDANGNNVGGTHYLSWSNGASDFDLILYDNTTTNVVASGANAAAGAFETFNYTIPGAQATFHLAVRRRGGPAASVFEIFSHNSANWNEYAVAAGSNTAPSNATHPHVISVGAVTQASYASAAGSNVVAGYSSRGPSNGGMTLPDLCGPTDTLVFPQPPATVPPTAPNTFGGTSCATPNSAGAAAAFWSADLNLDAPGVAWLLSQQAGIFRDWGPGGFENIYGAGGLRLTDFRAGTRWLARDYPGTVNDGSVPFHSVEQAHLRVPNGGRLLIFGANYGTFSEPVTLGHIAKGFVVEVVPSTAPAVLGN